MSTVFCNTCQVHYTGMVNPSCFILCREHFAGGTIGFRGGALPFEKQKSLYFCKSYISFDRFNRRIIERYTKADETQQIFSRATKLAAIILQPRQKKKSCIRY